MSDSSLRRPRAVTAGGRAFPVAIRRHPRARRYVIRLTAGGELRLTVPRGASIGGGLAFAERQHDWILREWQRLEQHAAAWDSGTELWYRGERVRLVVDADGVILGGHRLKRTDEAVGIRQTVEKFLRESGRSRAPGPAGRARRRTSAVNASRDRPQSAVSLGVLFDARIDCVELAADSDAARGLGLHHVPRARASPPAESLPALLARSRVAVPGVEGQRAVAAKVRERSAVAARQRTTIVVSAVSPRRSFTAIRCRPRTSGQRTPRS